MNSENRQKVIHERRPASVPVGRVAKQCHCGKWFELPACHAERHNSCTASCAASKRKADRELRRQSCAVCGESFIPRPNQLRNGGGRFCSKKCALSTGPKSEKWLPALLAGVERRKAAGGYVGKSGSENPMWKGGCAVARRRRIESGKANEYTRKYRAANPDKTREWRHRRNGRKYGRLPRGTVANLLRLQRDRCANCKCSLKGKYHVDHIMPLHLGGKHEPENVQLLCPPCNVRKWALDPIEFAQRNGRLL